MNHFLLEGEESYLEEENFTQESVWGEGMRRMSSQTRSRIVQQRHQGTQEGVEEQDPSTNHRQRNMKTEVEVRPGVKNTIAKSSAAAAHPQSACPTYQS
jgi:hypothetical protein